MKAGAVAGFSTRHAFARELDNVYCVSDAAARLTLAVI
jgi:hypothetical protein